MIDFIRKLKQKTAETAREAYFDEEAEAIDSCPIAASHFLTAVAHLKAAQSQFELAALHCARETAGN